MSTENCCITKKIIKKNIMKKSNTFIQNLINSILSDQIKKQQGQL